MPGKEGLATKSGDKVLDRIDQRDRFLSLLREGNSRQDAAAILGLAYSTVYRYYVANPNFLLAIQDSEAERVEGTFRFLEDVINDDSVDIKDRLSAADKVLKHRARDNRSDTRVVEHKHTLELVGGDRIDDVLAIEKRLAIDVESRET